MIFKMEADILLINSNLCRLCSEENSNGIDLFTADENSEDLCTLVNKYLPIKVENEGFFPRTICPGCHIQLEATKLFMDLIIEGQGKLRNLLRVQQERLNREEKERYKLEQALQNHNPNASVETYTIQTDQNGEKYIIQIYSEGPLFLPEHELALKAEGLDKPKRKRGRPPKAVTTEVPAYESNEPTHEDEGIEAPTSPDLTEDSNIRKKRKIRPPARYEGVVQGKELVKILKNEGVIDDTDILEDDEPGKSDEGFVPQQPSAAAKTVIGKIVSSDGKADTEQLIFMKPKPRVKKVKKKGFTKQKYFCDICNKEFQHYGRCEMHKRSHRIKYSCQDKDCTRQDESKSVIVEHQRETGHHGISMFEIINNINGIVVLNDVNELATIEPEEEGKVMQVHCEKCDKTFSCKQNYEVHLKATHEGEKPFKCKICQKAFAYASSLKHHMLSHKLKADTDDNSYSCDMCDKICQHPSSLIYHKDTEHGNRKFICNKCNKCFKHRQLLLRHQLVHSDDRPFKCEDCNRKFKTKTNLVNHQNVHKGIKKFICPICGNTFLHKTSLWVHLKWHDGNKPFECDVCKKAFFQKGNLIEHQRIHTGEKPFSCNLCGRCFTTSSQCKLHVKRHTGEKPYGCKYCQKRFLHQDTYEAHVRRHLDERPFHCKFCPKAFPEKWACTRHERVHLGLKTYKCEVCNKAFSDCANYSKHKKLHFKNGIKPETLDKKPEDNAVNSEIVESQEVSNIAIEFVSVPEEESVDKKTEETVVVNPPDLSIHDLLDHEGNTISITTADGQPIPIVSSGNEKFQGLLPDGTLVSFDILPDGQVKETEVDDEEEEEEPTQLATATSEVNLLNTEIHFLDDNSISNATAGVNAEKPAFLSEDGKVCFITAFDENSFLTMS